LQFSFTVGIVVNFVFATLIAFAFIFSAETRPVFSGEFLQFFFFILAGIFVINWQPILDISLIVFGIIPLFIYFFRIFFRLESWIGVVMSLFFGFIVLYLLTAPRFIIFSMPLFFLDLFMGSAFGFIVFLSMNHSFINNR
jgi:hypothetical protein